MPKVFREHLPRSFVKTISFRVLAIVSNLLIIYFVTGELKTVFTVVGIATVVNTLLYFFHERVWNKIHWGRKVH